MEKLIVMVLVLQYPSTYVLEVRQWKLRTNFALCLLLPSLASNLKCSPSLYPSSEKDGFAAL